MTTTIEKATQSITLLYFDGCPNVDEARRHLRAALAQAGHEPKWAEVNIRESGTPDKWRGFPSPTVMVDGRDIVSGADSAAGSGACRFGGAPSVEAIAARLGRPRRRSPGSWITAIVAVPVAVLGAVGAPACGACIPALAGLLSALGLGGLAVTAVLKPVMIALLAVAAFGFVYQFRRGGKVWPLVFGLAGIIGVYLATYTLASTGLKVLSIALLIGASIWNTIPALRWGKAKSCPACAEEVN